jgi:hypothetical protein
MTSVTKSFAGVAIVVAALVILSAPGTAATPAPGYVGAPGSIQAEPPTAAELDSVRAQVTTWLVRNGFDGYRVSRVTAWTNNDSIVVQDRRGANAFELLASPGAGWLMQEPTSMLWNAKYGMRRSFESNWSGTGEIASLMGGGRPAGQWDGWFAAGKTKVKTAAAAVAVANRWLAKSHAGEKASGAVRRFPGYFTIGTSYRDKPAGLVSVNAGTGAVWYHGWLGGFLAARSY